LQFFHHENASPLIWQTTGLLTQLTLFYSKESDTTYSDLIFGNDVNKWSLFVQKEYRL
jgi:hypothetical protein